MPVVNKLNIDSIAEWSLMFGDFVGKNPDAVTLLTKGALREPTLVERGLALLGIKKGAQLERDTFLAAEDLAKLGLVARKGTDAAAIAQSAVEQAAQNMSWDVFYNLFGQAQYDMSLVIGAGDVFTDDERAGAFQRVLEGFGAAAQKLLPILLGSGYELVVEEKGGKRHSAADQKRLDDMGDHLDKAAALHKELTTAKDAKPDDAAKGDVAPPAAAEPVAPVVEVKGDVAPAAQPLDVDALAAKMFELVTPLVEGVKGHVETKLTEFGTAVDAKLAETTAKVDAVAKGVETTQKTALEASAAAVAAARAPSAPGGVPTYTGAEGDEAYKGAPLTSTGEAIEVAAPDPNDPQAAGKMLRSIFRQSH